jgi:hypothetical protein
MVLAAFAENMSKFVGIMDKRDIQNIAIRPTRV